MRYDNLIKPFIKDTLFTFRMLRGGRGGGNGIESIVWFAIMAPIMIIAYYVIVLLFWLLVVGLVALFLYGAVRGMFWVYERVTGREHPKGLFTSAYIAIIVCVAGYAVSQKNPSASDSPTATLPSSVPTVMTVRQEPLTKWQRQQASIARRRDLSSKQRDELLFNTYMEYVKSHKPF